MSSNYRLICRETKKMIWVGQGWSDKGMETFYSGEEDTMNALGLFLKEHEGKDLVLVNSDYHTKDDLNKFEDITMEYYNRTLK